MNIFTNIIQFEFLIFKVENKFLLQIYSFLAEKSNI